MTPHIYVLTLHLIIAAKNLSPPPPSQVPTPPRKPQPLYNFFRDKLSTINTIAAYLFYSNEIDKAVLFLGRCPFYTHIPQPSVFFFLRLQKECTSNSNYIQTGSWCSKLWVGKLTFDSQVNPLRIGLGIHYCPICEPSSREALEQ